MHNITQPLIRYNTRYRHQCNKLINIISSYCTNNNMATTNNNSITSSTSSYNKSLLYGIAGIAIGALGNALYKNVISRRTSNTLGSTNILNNNYHSVAVAVDTAHPLYNVTIEQLHQYLNNKTYTCVQLVEYYLNQISLIDGELKSMMHVTDKNKLLAQAAKCDEERSNNTHKGFLHGIPILVKDNVDVADMPCTAGSLALKDNIPSKDATLISYIKKQGAIILGKTNMSEWANFRSTSSVSGWSPIGGQCKNPYAYDRCTSGSSSGSAAAVAAGLCVASLGSETDGSIVSPANNCGLVGIKPSVGLVSRYGVIPVSFTQDTVGPLAKTVKDCCYVLNSIVGPDSNDSACDHAKGHVHDDYTKFCDINGLQGARIGVIRNLPGFRDTFRQAFQRGVDIIKGSGATVVDDLELPHCNKLGLAYYDAEQTVLLYDFKNDLNDYLKTTDPTKVKTRTIHDVIEFNKQHKDVEMPTFDQERMIMAADMGSKNDKEYKDAIKDCLRMSYTEGIKALIDKHNLDCLISPTGTAAWVIDHILSDHFDGSSSSIAAVARTPHITVPLGLTHGLPTGISFLGDMWREDKLIRIAYAFEQKTKWRQDPKFYRAMPQPIAV